MRGSTKPVYVPVVPGVWAKMKGDNGMRNDACWLWERNVCKKKGCRGAEGCKKRFRESQRTPRWRTLGECFSKSIPTNDTKNRAKRRYYILVNTKVVLGI
jgi:hypothetical protein